VGLVGIDRRNSSFERREFVEVKDAHSWNAALSVDGADVVVLSLIRSPR
jgi:hypothetical protein